MREELDQLAKDLRERIEQFEQKTGLLVSSNIQINRGGCTDSMPYRVNGVYVTVGVNSYWKPKATS